ncbi:hypothetical protein QJQ45_008506 [Haematococcus lacustris]|nr:hypothetical protein QJQ45_008506 [Haematococcus lacustris]
MSLVAQCLRGSDPAARIKSRILLKARESKSGELRADHIATVHAIAGPSNPPGKQREERRAEWKTQRRQVICEYFANSNKLTPYNQLQRRLGRPGQILHYSIKPAFDDPSNQELLAKLQQLGSVNLTGDHNTISHHSMQPRGTDQRRGRVVLVDEHRTTRVNSAVNGQQPCERQLNKRRATRPASWKPPAGQVEQRLLRPAWSKQRDQPPSTKAEPEAEPTQPTKSKGKAQGKAAKAKPAPQPGRWLDRDCNAALNMQRIGESKWRPLELCYWPEQGKLPAKGKEYPGLGYKRLRDKPPKAQQQQQPATAQ